MQVVWFLFHNNIKQIDTTPISNFQVEKKKNIEYLLFYALAHI